MDKRQQTTKYDIQQCPAMWPKESMKFGSLTRRRGHEGIIINKLTTYYILDLASISLYADWKTIPNNQTRKASAERRISLRGELPMLQSARLNSWKEIAVYLGRDVRTVLRWEKERGLPVRCIPGGKRRRVFAYQAEVEAWLGGLAPRPNDSSRTTAS